MMNFLRRICGFSKEDPKKDFSAFFTTASENERKDLLKQVVREANEDQKKMMEEVGEILSREKTAHV